MARSIFFYTDSAIFGGAEQALLTLIGAIDRGDWRPTLLMHESPGMERMLGLAAELDTPVRLLAPIPLGLAGARRVPVFAAGLRRERPDVFHAHMSWPLAAKYALAGAVVARVPAVVATVHHFGRLELDRSTRVQLRALAAGVGRYIAVSRDIRASLIGRLGVPAGKVEIVRNGVAVERLASPESPRLRAELASASQRSVVLTCARLDPLKGIDVLLRAAKELPDVAFAIAGEGPERGALEAQASSLDLGDQVAFLGRRGDVPSLLAACDAVALPSLVEGTSLAVLEAMAAGRAVVSTDIPGTDELIADGVSGLLVPPSDHVALASALRRVLGDEALRASLARAGRERVVREFSAGRMGGRVAAIYRELLDQR